MKTLWPKLFDPTKGSLKAAWGALAPEAQHGLKVLGGTAAGAAGVGLLKPWRMLGIGDGNQSMFRVG